MSEVIASAAKKQESSTLFELAPIKDKRVQMDFSAPKLSAFGGLAAIREYERPDECCHEIHRPLGLQVHEAPHRHHRIRQA